MEQYKNDFFRKLGFPFKKNKRILDVGCGDGTDGEIFVKRFGLLFYGTDIYEDENIKKLRLTFKKGSIYKIPYGNNIFDYVFSHDVFHHLDEPKQREEKITSGLKELRRVCKKGGYIIVVEGNRYNPLFFPHMVVLRGHNHFTQKKFRFFIESVFKADKIQFKFFEAHLYPQALLPLFKIYEYVMERFSPRKFLSYNAAIIQKA